MLINGGMPVSLLELYRIIWIGGRTGGYKTSLGIRLAREYLDRGYHLVTNTPCIWADDIESIHLDSEGHLNTVVILDEGGKDIKWSRQWEDLMSYVAKMNFIFIMCSFVPPVRTAQMCTIQPLGNLKQVMLPVVIYKWRISHYAVRESGVFAWWGMEEMYGIYSRQNPGAKAGKILRWLIDRKMEFERFYGIEEDDNGISGLEKPSAGELMADAAESFAQAADDIAAIPIRKYRKR